MLLGHDDTDAWDELIALLAGISPAEPTRWTKSPGCIGEARAQAEPEALAEIARLCGYLPLALRVAVVRLGRVPVDHPAGPGVRRRSLEFRESGSLRSLCRREPLSRNRIRADQGHVVQKRHVVRGPWPPSWKAARGKIYGTLPSVPVGLEDLVVRRTAPR
jgi:hypothetical protein